MFLSLSKVLFCSRAKDWNPCILQKWNQRATTRWFRKAFSAMVPCGAPCWNLQIIEERAGEPSFSEPGLIPHATPWVENESKSPEKGQVQMSHFHFPLSQLPEPPVHICCQVLIAQKPKPKCLLDKLSGCYFLCKIHPCLWLRVFSLLAMNYNEPEPSCVFYQPWHLV